VLPVLSVHFVLLGVTAEGGRPSTLSVTSAEPAPVTVSASTVMSGPASKMKPLQSAQHMDGAKHRHAFGSGAGISSSAGLGHAQSRGELSTVTSGGLCGRRTG
jgi:hypothetical protein